MMKNLGFLFVILFLLGCSSDEEITVKETPITSTFIEVAKGDLYGAGEENIVGSTIVVVNEESWNELIQKMNSVNNVSDSFNEVDIDFTQYAVICLFKEVCPNAGHWIKITNIIETDQSIQIFVDQSTLGNAATVMTQPYYIAKIEKSQKSIEFL